MNRRWVLLFGTVLAVLLAFLLLSSSRQNNASRESHQLSKGKSSSAFADADADKSSTANNGKLNQAPSFSSPTLSTTFIDPTTAAPTAAAPQQPKRKNLKWIPTTCARRLTFDGDSDSARRDEVISSLTKSSGIRLISDCLSWSAGNFQQHQQEQQGQNRSSTGAGGDIRRLKSSSKWTLHPHMVIPSTSIDAHVYTDGDPKKSRWNHGDINDINDKANDNNKNGHSNMHRAAVGAHLAVSIARRIRVITPTSNTETPPWIVLVGDSRMRQLFRRLVWMIRFSPAVHSNGDDDYDYNYFAQQRDQPGIYEERFHRNATFVVFGTSVKEPVEDKFTILPVGRGCAAGDPQEKTKNGAEGAGGLVILFQVCFHWHTEVTSQDVLSQLQLLASSSPQQNNHASGGPKDDLIHNAVSLVWMPTLWGCVKCWSAAEKRQKAHDINNLNNNVHGADTAAEVKRQQLQEQEVIDAMMNDRLYPCCPSRSRQLLKTAKDSALLVGNSTNIQNFVLMTVPQSSRPDLHKRFPSYGIFQQNHASVFGFDEAAQERDGMETEGTRVGKKKRKRELADRKNHNNKQRGRDDQPVMRPRPLQVGRYFHDKGLFVYALQSILSGGSSGILEDEQENSAGGKQQQQQQQMRPPSPSTAADMPPMQQWVLDYMTWSDVALKPVMCDYVHLMCQLRRRMRDVGGGIDGGGGDADVDFGFENKKSHHHHDLNDNNSLGDYFVSGDCNMCHDEVGFLVVLEVLRLALA